jgi:hypothetical protein
VEPDLVDGYANDTGFPLTAQEQLAYNRMIAGLAHERGMGVALQKDVGQVRSLVRDFDFSVDEECVRYGECEGLTPFVADGKAVLHVEYDVDPGSFCAVTGRLGFSSMVKHMGLDGWRVACPAGR